MAHETVSLPALNWPDSSSPKAHLCLNLSHFSVRPEVERKGLVATKESCWAYYVQKCRNNLHVVLAMSPVGETLRTRCRNFPGMVNNTVIDWFEPWPEQVCILRCAVKHI